jgi:hypothetical protein
VRKLKKERFRKVEVRKCKKERVRKEVRKYKKETF